MMLSGWFQPGVILRRIVKKIAENVFGGNKYFEPISLLSCSITQPFMDSNPPGVNIFGGSLSYRQNSVRSPVNLFLAKPFIKWYPIFVTGRI